MNIRTKDLTRISIFTALTALGAFISLPLGPVPFTLQTFFVLLAGIFLGARNAMLSQVAYLLLGLVGLPIFSNFTGGFQSIYTPSFGFLISFIFAAFIMGKILEKDKSTSRIILAVIIGNIIFYLIGLPYLAMILKVMGKEVSSIKGIFAIGMTPFILGDIVKSVVAVIVGKAMLRRIPLY